MSFTRRAAFTLPVGLYATAAFAAPKKPVTPATPALERWGLHEISLKGPDTGNPFLDVDLSADFTDGAEVVRVPGFYDGDGNYCIRFSPPKTGTWRWVTRSNIKALDGQTGQAEALAPSKNNHGPVKVTLDGYHFTYADGTPFRQIGTTCYAWAQQSDARCAQTIQTLTGSPYNKLRMCVFPNVAAEPIHPFVQTGTGDRDWDGTRFNPAYFRRFESRVKSLLDIGVEADIIIFHPYDEKRGFSDQNRVHDERYLRYLIARLSAFRNVWWSAANEYDDIKTKSMADWDHILELLHSEDPHHRLRSIHNIKVLYDNNKPWITHASVQNGTAVLDDRTAETYRSVWKKPVIFDEVCYEGDIALRWGNLSGQEMVMRFWHGHIAGTYVGHSETYTPNKSGADGSWLGKGGTMLGTSTPRLAFLKKVMEDGPAPGIDPIDKWWERHIAGKEGRYYLRYFGDQAPAEWAVDLPRNGLKGGEQFRVEVLDTWNMTVTPVEGVFTVQKKDNYNFHDPARPTITLPGNKWMAVRITRV
ncbi:DUF5605 domain-containing protein [Asticcacaulis sp. YBE204]|uniref:DUF5605 domain-containing protein n=1 Tax=Asticcacaulis sp. YBE204 TaxID=1282363 RepID=UPI0003C3BED5|nr:DUF5605 domain-containing protein [Asticcacaulis sp. YBE204]ESQ78909.1 hypothetical protein AEYBE204_10825 [Asticcacaulis sp. YBE204]